MTGRTRLPHLALASLCAVLALSWPVAARAQANLDLPPADNVGYLGFGWALTAVLGPDPDSPPQSGMYPVVDNVDKCSPAEKAGLRVGDELMVVDGRDARGPGYIFEDSPTREPGAMHAFTVRRGDELIELTITSTEPLGKDEKPADRCEEGKPSPS